MTTIVEFPDRGALVAEAAEWLVRLDADTPPTHDEMIALSEWLHRSPAHREELEALAALWGRMNILTELAVPLGSATRPAHARVQDRAFMQSPWSRRGLLAASIVLMLALTWMLVVRQPAPDPLLATNGLYATTIGQQKAATLADGSQVLLNTNSQIKVDYSAGYRRVHLLQGEALFTVTKNAERPFRVYAGNGRVEALGTAFSVYLKGGDVNVTVTEGRVSLASMRAPQSQSVTRGGGQAEAPDSERDADEALVQSLGTLSAGQVATIRTALPESPPGSVSVLEARAPVAPEQLAERMAWREGFLMFSGETLEDVVKELGRYTTVSIEIPDATLRSMRIGGRFPVGETETMLSTLETNFNLRVIRLGQNRVVLAPAGD